MCRFCGILLPKKSLFSYGFDGKDGHSNTIEIRSDIAKDIIDEIHYHQQKINHLNIDNNALLLHNQSYEQELDALKQELNEQLQRMNEYANQQTDIAMQQEIELAQLRDNQQYLIQLQNSSNSMHNEIKALKSQNDKYIQSIKDLREELNQSRSIIALYKYPKAKNLHKLTSYNRSENRYKNLSRQSIKNLDDKLLNKMNKPSIKTYKINPNQYQHKNTHSLPSRGRNRAKSEFIQSAMTMLKTSERLKKAMAHQ